MYDLSMNINRIRGKSWIADLSCSTLNISHDRVHENVCFFQR